MADVRIRAPLRFAPRSEPQPDVALVKLRADGYRNAHPVAAEVLLVIEVSDSTLRYDLEVKTRLYATHGVAEYWVVNLLEESVYRHRRPTGQQYAERDEFKEGVLPLPAFIGEIHIARLF